MILEVKGNEEFENIYSKRLDLDAIITEVMSVKFFIDVQNGNPNGDPEDGGRPREKNGYGEITDVSLKSRIRNCIAVQLPHLKNIEQKDNVIANEDCKYYKNKKINIEKYCEDYTDARMFGHVFNVKGVSAYITGAIQFSCAKTVEPITASKLSITRAAASNVVEVAVKKDSKSSKEKSSDLENLDQEEEMTRLKKTGNWGAKSLVEHGLYYTTGTVMPSLARKTGMTNRDFLNIIKSLPYLYELNHSANVGLTSVVCAYVVFHNHEYGRMQRGFISNNISAISKIEVPKSYEDYTFSVNEAPFSKMDVFKISYT